MTREAIKAAILLGAPLTPEVVEAAIRLEVPLPEGTYDMEDGGCFVVSLGGLSYYRTWVAKAENFYHNGKRIR